MIEVVKLEKTCEACPSQWEGVTADHRPVYIRYRYGYLSVIVGPQRGNVRDAIRHGEEIFGRHIGRDLDGVLRTDEMTEVTGEVVTWNY